MAASVGLELHADGGAAGQADGGDMLVFGDPLADLAAATGDNLHGVGRHTGLEHELGIEDDAHRRIGGGLHDDAVAGAQGGGDLVRHGGNGIVERGDTYAHA